MPCRDRYLARHLLEVGTEGFVGTGRQELDGSVLGQIGDDSPGRAGNVQFIDTEARRRFEVELVDDGLVPPIEDIADGLLVDAKLAGQVGEVALQGEVGNAIDETGSGPVVVVNPVQGMEERGTASTTPPALSRKVDAGNLPQVRQVHDVLLVRTMGVQRLAFAVRAGGRLPFASGVDGECGAVGFRAFHKDAREIERERYRPSARGKRPDFTWLGGLAVLLMSHTEHDTIEVFVAIVNHTGSQLSPAIDTDRPLWLRICGNRHNGYRCHWRCFGLFDR